MGPSIRVTPVVQQDVPTLGRIFTEAFNDDLLRLFIFSHGRDFDLSLKFNVARHEREYAKVSTRFIKAIDEATYQIVGFITWTVIENQQDEEERDFPPPMNKEFNQAVFGELQKRRIKTMRGKRHICKPSFGMCLPQVR